MLRGVDSGGLGSVDERLRDFLAFRWFARLGGRIYGLMGMFGGYWRGHLRSEVVLVLGSVSCVGCVGGWGRTLFVIHHSDTFAVPACTF